MEYLVYLLVAIVALLAIIMFTYACKDSNDLLGRIWAMIFGISVTFVAIYITEVAVKTVSKSQPKPINTYDSKWDYYYYQNEY